MAARTHSIENALNIDYLDPDLVSAMQKAWCYETAYNGCKDDYWAENPALDSESDTLEPGTDNPSLGNCFMTTLVAWAARGFVDEIVPCLVSEPGKDPESPAWHFYLEIDLGEAQTIEVDPTRQQFKPEYKLEPVRPNHPRHNEMLYYSVFEPQESDSVRYRLGLMLALMNDRDAYDPGYTADEIIQRLEEKFAYARQPATQPNAAPSP